MATKIKPLQSHPDMLEWQLRTLIAELSHVTLHASDESCPCNQVALQPGEYCLGKHLLNVSSLASETAMMDDNIRNLLDELSSEALGHHSKAKEIYCKGGTWPDLAQWSRDWRKKLEPLYYSCDSRKKVKLAEGEIIFPLAQPVAKITGTCKNQTCGFKVTATEKVEGSTASVKNLDQIIKEVLEKAQSAKSKASNKTFAMGISGVTRYDFEFKIVEAEELLVSNDPFTFIANPDYPPELQPRLRDRAATRLQVQNIAANLEPDALLVDYRSIDRGAPIIGPDKVVESGNGRIMALRLAARDFPQVYTKYRQALKDIAPAYALPADRADNLKTPVLVRERLSKVTRKQFVEEANSSTTIESSAVEKARTDAEKISMEMLNSLSILENESIEDALRSSRNKNFVSSFLNRLSANEQARLVDAKAVLNQDGVHRMAMGIFVATFRGDVGLRLAEKFFESTDLNVRNVFNGISLGLGRLAQAERLAAEGKRDPDYAIGEDLAKSISSYSAIKKTSGMTVDKYLKQSQMFERDLTPFQERLLIILDNNSRSAKRIGSILHNYAELVIESAAPDQGALIPGSRARKEELFETAVIRSANLEKVVAQMFERKPFCRSVSAKIVDAINRAQPLAEQPALLNEEKRECGATVCRQEDNTLVYGSRSCGSENNMSILVGCPGDFRPVAIVHNHPNDTPHLSPVDIETSRRTGLTMCIITKSKGVECWKP